MTKVDEMISRLDNLQVSDLCSKENEMKLEVVRKELHRNGVTLEEADRIISEVEKEMNEMTVEKLFSKADNLQVMDECNKDQEARLEVIKRKLHRMYGESISLLDAFTQIKEIEKEMLA